MTSLTAYGEQYRYSNHTRAHTVILGRLTTRKIPQKAIPHGPESPVAGGDLPMGSNSNANVCAVAVVHAGSMRHYLLFVQIIQRNQ